VADSRHHVALCGCGGLVAVEMKKLPGVTGFTLRMGDGQVISGGNPEVYIGPAAEPCTARTNELEHDRA
jgi:hypothetical protein